METEILSLINKGDNKYDIGEKLGRACFKVYDKSNHKTYILKFQPEVKSTLQIIWRFLFNGSLPYQNEFRINNALSNTGVVRFKAPQFKNFVINKYYICDFIEEKKQLTNKADSIYSEIGKALYDFSKIAQPKKFFFIKEWAFRALESPSFRLYFNILKANKKHSFNKKNILLIVSKLKNNRASAKQKMKPCLIHNDLGPNNVLIGPDNGIFIIDWEDAIWENKWPLIDIVTISMDLLTGELNPGLLRAYLDEYTKAGKSIPDDVLKYNLQFAYIIYLFRAINMKRINEEERHAIYRQIKDIGDDNMFIENWWQHVLQSIS